jgi:hypothetical protein
MTSDPVSRKECGVFYSDFINQQRKDAAIREELMRKSAATFYSLIWTNSFIIFFDKNNGVLKKK